jgi:hypothetical protein
MKTIFAALLLAVSVSAVADKNVSGYMRQDGTYVQPYHRSNPNNSRYDNYSSQGNSNPYTGQRGSERNEFSNPPAFNQQNTNGDYINRYKYYGQ